WSRGAAMCVGAIPDPPLGLGRIWICPVRMGPPSAIEHVAWLIDTDAGSVQNWIWNLSLAPGSELSSTYTRTDWKAGALLGHSTFACVQSPTSWALPPVPLGLGGPLSAPV